MAAENSPEETPAPQPRTRTIYTFQPAALPDYSDTCWIDAFTPDEAARIIELAEPLPLEDAQVGAERQLDANIRCSRVRWLPLDPSSAWIYQRIADIARGVNDSRYQFELNGLYEGLQVAEYGPGSYFHWHKDHGPGPHTTRKLSVTVQLSDEDAYEGGVMEFLHGPTVETARRKVGSMILFPSYVLHRVTEVTKGTRHSIVAWISGPPYR
jgi:PKHD-type hydroxylase